MARGKIIPWHLFFQTLKMQPRVGTTQWLARWYFSDDGVFARFEQPQPAKDLRRQVENTVIQLLKRRGTFQ